MGLALDAFETYGLVAAAFETGLAALILASGAAPQLRVAFAVILLGNAFQAASTSLVALGMPRSMEWLGGDLFDPLIVTTIAFVMTQVPTPLGGARGARIATTCWALALIAWTLLAFVFHANDPTPEGRLMALGKWPFQRIPFLLASYFFAAHVVPRWLALSPGPLRGQMLLVAMGCAIGLASAGMQQLLALLQDGGNAFHEAFQAIILLFLLPALAALMVDGHADARLLALVVATGMLFALAERLLRVANMGEFSSQAIRPAMIAFAILRYDLVDTPGATRRIIAPITGIAFALTLFFGLSRMLSGQSEALEPIASAASLAFVAGVAIAARRPLGTLLRAAGGERAAADRIERYRLALEAEGPPFASTRLVEMRRRLRITDEEHDTLVAILRSHVVVPTRAVRGLQAGDTVAGRYEVARELGRGGQGRALLAREAGTGGPVVLKEIARPWEEGAAERLDALRREADAGARVRSPRVARVMGVVEDAGIAYLVREYVAGRTLDASVADEGPFPEARARAVMLDVLAGLAAIHDAGLLHLDLKPSNVVLDENGRAVIIDLGTARREAAAGTLTQGAAPGGTLGWMAPEQAGGERVGRAADVYGAGALLSFLLTARRPTPGSVVAVDGEFRDIVQRACARDLAARYAAADELAAAIASS